MKPKKSIVKMLQKEVEELIRHTEEFSVLLKKLIKQGEIDIEMEREMTVKVLEVILQKWMVEIIHLLFMQESMRFNGLKRSLRGISSRTLADKLKTLEDAGYSKREIVGERPVKIAYSLTEKGAAFARLSMPIIFYLKMQEMHKD